MKAIGRIVRCMGRESIRMQMVMFMKAIGRMVRCMGRESIRGQVVMFMKAMFSLLWGASDCTPLSLEITLLLEFSFSNDNDFFGKAYYGTCLRLASADGYDKGTGPAASM